MDQRTLQPGNIDGKSRKFASPHLRKPYLKHILALTISLSLSAIFLASFASPASALTYGIGWRNYDTSELETAQHSGATVYRMPIDKSANGGSWESLYDPIFKKAWELGITILPNLTRYGSGGTRFLTSSDPEYGAWYTWTKQVVERYGYNGTFWEGKANPKPVTAWEVWNEPNLVGNNPVIGKAACQALGQTYYESENTCIQPQNYGAFLIYTSVAIQAGSQSRAGVNTQVLFGGLNSPFGESGTEFLKKTSAVSGVPSSYSGVSIHPYALVNGVSEMQAIINGYRNTLDGDISEGHSKSLWITELGWPVGGTAHFPTGGHSVSEGEQANLLTQSFNWIKGVAGGDQIQLVTWYNIQDFTPAGDPSRTFWDDWCGLRDLAGNYRPSWWAFQEETGATPWPAPSATTADASQIQERQATLNGRIDPHGTQTSFRFEYGTSTAYGTSIPVPNGEVGSGNGDVEKSVAITNLQPNTHYHYRLVATSKAGTTYGTDHAFSTGVKWMIKNANSEGVPDASFWFGLPGQIPVIGDWDGNGTETAGSYEPSTGTWRLRNSNSTGGAEITFTYGGSQFTPVAGDWDGNGTTTIGLYEPQEGRWRLRNSNSGGNPDLNFTFGGSQFTPVAGDWDGNGTTTIGLYEPQEGRWRLRNSNSGGNPDLNFTFGGSQFTPVAGDWDGNGTTTIGLYEPQEGRWRLRNSNSGGNPDLNFTFGGSQYRPLVGDWDGNGTTSVGLADPDAPVERNWLPRNSNSGGSPDINFWYGWPGESAVVGDWNGDGGETPGTYIPSAGEWRLRNSNSTGAAEITFTYGGSQFVPVAGDWDGNGTTTIGLYEPKEGRWELRNSNSGGSPNLNFTYGGSQFTPVAGDWDGNGTTTIGLYEPKEGRWELRNSNSGGSPNLNFTYGGSQFTPVAGDWDGNGTTTIGLYEPKEGRWELRNSNSGGSPNLNFTYGGSQFTPVAGDWDGNGTTTIGLVSK